MIRDFVISSARSITVVVNVRKITYQTIPRFYVFGTIHPLNFKYTLPWEILEF